MEGLDDIDMTMITVTSNDNHNYELTSEQAGLSQLMQNMMENDNFLSEINLNYPSSIVEPTIKFLQHYASEPFTELQKAIDNSEASITQPLKFINKTTGEDITTFTSVFYSSLVPTSVSDIIEYMNVVLYMGIDPLFHLIAAALGKRLSNLLDTEIVDLLASELPSDDSNRFLTGLQKTNELNDKVKATVQTLLN